MRVLWLDAFHAGSHRSVAEGYAQHSRHSVTVLGMNAAGGWRWRMRGAAITFSQMIQERWGTASLATHFDVVVVTDMLDVATWMGLDRTLVAGVRVVLYGGWAGIRPQDASADVHVLQRSAPHAWLFPRMAGVVHHGGAGTTGAAARAGVPQLVVPHFADQPYWGRRMYELGVGLRPVDKMRLNENMLATALRALVDDAVLRSNAQALGERVRMEDGVGRAVKILTEVQQ